MAHRHRRVVWTRAARVAADGILGFVAADAPQAAVQLLDWILEAASSLLTLAERGRSVPEVRMSPIRELLIGSFRLIYEVQDDEVIILALLHQARDLNRWRRENPNVL